MFKMYRKEGTNVYPLPKYSECYHVVKFPSDVILIFERDEIFQIQIKFCLPFLAHPALPKRSPLSWHLWVPSCELLASLTRRSYITYQTCVSSSIAPSEGSLPVRFRRLCDLEQKRVDRGSCMARRNWGGWKERDRDRERLSFNTYIILVIH